MSGRVPAEVFPPGEFIRDEIEARGWTQTDLAEILGRPFRLVNEILSGKRAITPETALGLGDAFGTGPQFWMNLESAYRLSLVEGGDRSVSRRAKLFDKAPIKDMVRRGWLSQTENLDVLERELLDFFELRNIDDTPALVAAARKSTDYAKTTAPQWAWLYRAKQMAQAVSVPPFHKGSLEAALPKIHEALGKSDPEVKALKLLAGCGIRVVVVEHLPRTKIDGAAFWLDDGPVIALSLRFDRNDAFWFTLGHELGHVYYQDGALWDDDLVGQDAASNPFASPEIERRADAFASNLLIPPDKIESFIQRTRPYYSKAKINQFANSIHVHPGVIVGQLQRRREMTYAQNREMLVKIRDDVMKTSPTDGWQDAPRNP